MCDRFLVLAPLSAREEWAEEEEEEGERKGRDSTSMLGNSGQIAKLRGGANEDLGMSEERTRN